MQRRDEMKPIIEAMQGETQSKTLMCGDAACNHSFHLDVFVMLQCKQTFHSPRFARAMVAVLMNELIPVPYTELKFYSLFLVGEMVNAHFARQHDTTACTAPNVRSQGFPMWAGPHPWNCHEIPPSVSVVA